MGAKASAAAIAVRATVALMCHVEEDCEDMTKAQSFLLVTLPARFKWARPGFFQSFLETFGFGEGKKSNLAFKGKGGKGRKVGPTGVGGWHLGGG